MVLMSIDVLRIAFTSVGNNSSYLLSFYNYLASSKIKNNTR